MAKLKCKEVAKCSKDIAVQTQTNTRIHRVPGSPGYMPNTLSTSRKLRPTAWTSKVIDPPAAAAASVASEPRSRRVGLRELRAPLAGKGRYWWGGKRRGGVDGAACDAVQREVQKKRKNLKADVMLKIDRSASCTEKLQL
jgi:hypothetical protein